MFLSLDNRPDGGAGVRARGRFYARAPLKLAALSLAIQGVCSQAAAATQAAADSQLLAFNTSFLQGAASSVDLQLLLGGTRVLPGSYRVDLYSNDMLVGRRDIDFRQNPDNGRVEPCLPLELLTQLGIDMEKLSAQGKLDLNAGQACQDIPALIEQATVRFDASRLRLDVSVAPGCCCSACRGHWRCGCCSSGS